MTIDQIIDAIDNFTPFGNEDPENDNESYFYRLMDELKKNSEIVKAIEPLFRLMEKYPQADFGSPGPIVHTLETLIGQYEEYLDDSLKRKPTPLTVWMLNRIINDEKNSIIKNNKIDRHQSLLKHPLANKETIETTQSFVDFQKKKD